MCKEMGESYGLQWGCRGCGNGYGRDAGLGGAPFGTFPGIGERQRSLLCLLFRCSCLLTISVQKKWGNTTVYNAAAGVVETAMGGMPGWAARLLARCPALANANVHFFVFFFVVLLC